MRIREELSLLLYTFRFDIISSLLAIGIGVASHFIPSYTRLFETHDPYISSLYLPIQTVSLPLLIVSDMTIYSTKFNSKYLL
jgi:hypothetical protein